MLTRPTTFLLAVFLLFMMAMQVFAGGRPADIPSTGFVKTVDSQERTMEFLPLRAEETLTLPVDESMKLSEIPLDSRLILRVEERDGESVVMAFNEMFVELTPFLVIALIIIELVGGMLSGFIGSGGAFVMTPAMMSLGISGVVAIASNMCHKFPKALVGAYKRFRYGQADLRLGLVIGTSAVVGVQIGIKVQKMILSAWGKAGSDLYMSLDYVAVLLFFGTYVLYDAWKLWRGGSRKKHQHWPCGFRKSVFRPLSSFPLQDLNFLYGSLCR